MPDNELDLKKIERVADMVPLRFRLPFASVTILCCDAAEICRKHIDAVWD
jgi:hypothetical protein